MGTVVAETFPPHAVCVPFPAQGHINPMLKLAKLLHQKGFHITFVNTEFNHRRLLTSRGSNSLDGIASFRFEAIPDGLPPSDADSTQDVPSLCKSTKKTCLKPFRDLLYKLNDSSSSNVPPVTCIVSDFSMCFTLEAAHELGIPIVLFWTASAYGFMAYLHYCHLVEKGFAPLKDASYLTNGYLDNVIDWIPGVEGICLKNLPSFIRTTDPNDIMLNFVIELFDDACCNASVIIFNSLDALEGEILNSLSSLIVPQIYTIGPLQLLLDNVQENDLASIGSNLWKEHPGCLEWLDSQEPNSVVYVNFGSITVLTSEQLIEFAWGLANSKKHFLWVIRPDIVIGETALLPKGFEEETKERSLLASWCPQEQVLGHPSIGGFLTHSGWNSTVESICSGVPMLCWPFFAEQQTNSWFCENKLGVGMEIDNNVQRNEIERLVRELMEGEKGKEMKDKAMELKRMAKEATASNIGSSCKNLQEMIMEVLLSQRNEIN